MRRHVMTILSGHVADTLARKDATYEAPRYSIRARRCRVRGELSGGVVLTARLKGKYEHASGPAITKTTRLSAGFSERRFRGAVAGLCMWVMREWQVRQYRENLYAIVELGTQQQKDRIERCCRRLGLPTWYDRMSVQDVVRIRRVASRIVATVDG